MAYKIFPLGQVLLDLNMVQTVILLKKIPPPFMRRAIFVNEQRKNGSIMMSDEETTWRTVFDNESRLSQKGDHTKSYFF